MMPINGTVCTKTSLQWLINAWVHTFQKRPLIGDVCMQMDMAQQDVSCSTVVERCKHKAPGCQRRQEKEFIQSADFRSARVPQSCPRSLGGKHAKLIMSPSKVALFYTQLDMRRIS